MNRKQRRRLEGDKSQLIFNLLRKRIAQELQRGDLEVKNASQLELAIGTFAPSNMIRGFKVSDYPFIGSRYLSIRDGHVYIVAGPTDDGTQVMAYRLGFLTSIFTHRGGMAVGITEDAWMDSRMIMYSLNHASFTMQQGELHKINDEVAMRRTYPTKKFMAWMYFVGSVHPFSYVRAGLLVARSAYRVRAESTRIFVAKFSLRVKRLFFQK